MPLEGAVESIRVRSTSIRPVIVVRRYSVRLNGITDLVITKLDLLTGLEKLPICVGYEINRRRVVVRHDLLPAR